MLRTISCPIDFSPGSRQAMRVAVELAREAKAHLALVHVFHLPALATSGEYPIDPGTLQALADDASRLLADAGREASALGAPHVTTTQRDGVPWVEIVELADHAHPDLIVMGTHGRSGVTRFLVGSVAETVVRHARGSVLVVRGDGQPAPFRRILCPVDFSPDARAALDRAAELAAPGGLIELLHVVELPAALSTQARIATPQALEEGAARLLDRWALELRARTRAEVTAQVRLGAPASAILDATSRQPPFDLVVMGSHGRSGVRRLLLGSVAERTVRHAPCSVLVARDAA